MSAPTSERPRTRGSVLRLRGGRRILIRQDSTRVMEALEKAKRVGSRGAIRVVRGDGSSETILGTDVERINGIVVATTAPAVN